MLLRLGILATILLSLGLGIRDHWDSSEVRGPLVAEDMLSTGRVRPPYLLGEPYWNKPPLFHGLVALFVGATGSRAEWVARVPALVAATLTLLLMAAIARRIVGERGGHWTGIFLLSSMLFVGLARSCEMEMQLAAAAALAAYTLVREVTGDRRKTRLFFLAASAGVIATWTKGPALALLFPALLLVAFAWQYRSLRLLVGPTAIGTISGTVIATLLYYGPAYLDPNTRSELLARLSFGNVLHLRPWYYYLYQWPAALMPAALLLPWMIRDFRLAPAPIKSLVTASLLGVGVFSLSSSKQSHYLLPFIPWIAPWGGYTISRLRPGKWLLPATVLAMGGLVALDIGLALARNERESPKAALQSFESKTTGSPLATLDLSPSLVHYVGRRDLVLIRTGYETALQWLAEHPTGHLLVGIDRKTPFPEQLASAPVAARWDFPNGRNALVLLGPGNPR